eukprot:TRINITY_DN576_c0_g1_i1.p1 TRINITY_DN576_c0_g1~~TRINITY_DN576_c0_g1_i1.p1  ORF type:complete len:995 (+),score=278.67 TRINITY_DN576_c0_g1_i1:413-2986(+)
MPPAGMQRPPVGVPAGGQPPMPPMDPARPSPPTPGSASRPPPGRAGPPTAAGYQNYRPQESGTKRIDRAQVPAPVFQAGARRKEWDTTSTSEPPPQPSSQFTVKDTGSASCRFMRCSLFGVPSDAEVLRQSGCVWGLALAPLASVEPGEVRPAVVQCPSKEGPVRCRRCRAFVNAGCTFLDGGRKWGCNLCGFPNAVPAEYFANLTPDGVRRDLAERPELMHGSVEWDVQDCGDYAHSTAHPADPSAKIQPTPSAGPPTPQRQLFVIDVSRGAADMLPSLASALMAAIGDMAGMFPNAQVSFVTYATSVHFYDFSAEAQPMHIVPDVDDVFVPLPFNNLCWMNAEADFDRIQRFLEALPGIQRSMEEQGSCVGSALSAAALVLDERGGRVFATASQLPTQGYGVVKRDDTGLKPVQGFWPDFATRCARRHVCVDLAAFTCGPADLATLGHVCSVTGGHQHHFNRFKPENDLNRLTVVLRRNLTREAGYCGILRLRCSYGIKVSSYDGHFLAEDPQDMDFAGVDADKTFLAELAHDGKVSAEPQRGQTHAFAWVQAALLYTRRDGQRRVRVHTLRLMVAKDVSTVFRMADLGATVATLSRTCVSKAVGKSVQVARDDLTKQCIAILAGYRKHCSSCPAGQLILPETLKLLPIYCLSLQKSPMFRNGMEADERVHGMFQLKSAAFADLLPHLYPHMYALHNMPGTAGVFDEDTRNFILPATEILNSDKVASSGVFMMHDYYTNSIYVWVGSAASPRTLQHLFGTQEISDDVAAQFPQMLEACRGADHNVPPGLVQMANLIDYLRSRRPTSHDTVCLMREGRDQIEELFFLRLVEDKNKVGDGYVDYLCQLHRQIQERLS